MRTVICTACGWASWAVTREYAERAVEGFNAVNDGANDEWREAYGRRASLDSYVCMQCGGAAFRPETPEDRIADGVTLKAVICDDLADNLEER
ncbi:MAG: hypothetical protein KF723_03620 [Rhizobiaceae bacterium]|nr:hypothetical protein [Rhizobiaceae bacterium]